MKFYEDKEYQEMSKALKGVCPEVALDFQLDDLVLCPDGSVRRIESISNMIYCRFRPDERKKVGDLWFKPEELVRLLTQEDLQEIYHKYYKISGEMFIAELSEALYHIIGGNVYGPEDYIRPHIKYMNRLMFAFVMHELYQKRWNPEKKEWEPKT